MKTSKPLIYLIILLSYKGKGQEPFVFSYEQNEIDYIADIQQVEDTFYLVQNRIYNIDLPWFDYDGYSDLILLSTTGELIDIHPLHGPQTNYQRILKIVNNSVYLAGTIKRNTCHFQLVLSKYDLVSKELVHLSTTDFCEHTLLNIKIRQGLNGNEFIEEYHIVDSNHFSIKQIFKIEDDFSLTRVLQTSVIYETFSVDFSRKGYLISEIGLYHFYDAGFNFRKQEFTNEFHGLSLHQTHTPFGPNYILEQSVQNDHNDPDQGLQLRLIDSNLNIIKKVVILPPHFYAGRVNLPFYGGISIDNENEIWAAADYTHLPRTDSSFITIIKLNRTLNILCQHFIGYDSYYRLFGINALKSGGAIAFGSRVRDGYNINEGEDVFAIRVGENCELPTTVSTGNMEESVPMISAYPNPGLNDLTFDVKGFDPASLRVEMIDVQGKVLFSTQDLSYSLQIPDLPPGQYFYRIKNGDQLLGIGAWVKQ